MRHLLVIVSVVCYWVLLWIEAYIYIMRELVRKRETQCVYGWEGWMIYHLPFVNIIPSNICQQTHILPLRLHMYLENYKIKPNTNTPRPGVCYAYVYKNQRNTFNRILHIIVQMATSFNIPNGGNWLLVSLADPKSKLIESSRNLFSNKLIISLGNEEKNNNILLLEPKKRSLLRIQIVHHFVSLFDEIKLST